jgi:vacuolar-type H+-ATPase subunit E/Vma4
LKEMAESLDKLHNRILSDAKLKAADINREAEEKARQSVDESRVQAQKDADEILSKANLEAESIRRGILSSRIRANRLRLLDEKNKIVQNVLKSVEQRLSDIASTDQFQPALKRFVAEAIDAIGMDDTIVRVGFQNAERKSLDSLGRTLPTGTRFVVEDNPIDGLGGVVAGDVGGKMIFNNSFRARIERLDNQLLTTISSTIFGE